jgi:hypothetical protein
MASFSTIQATAVSHDTMSLRALGLTYINYLKSNISYNKITCGEYSFVGSESKSVCLRNLEHIVETYGILKDEYDEYKKYVKQKEQELREEIEEEKRSKYSLESDARFFKMMSDLMVKRGKPPLPLTQATPEFLEVYNRMYPDG